MDLSIVIIIVIGLLLVNYFTISKVFLSFYNDSQYFRWMLKHGSSTRGIVVDIVQKENSDQQTMYAPVYKYTTVDGVQRLLTSEALSVKKPEIGNRVIVYYKTEKPDEAVVNPAGGYMLKTFLCILTVALLVSLDVAVVFAVCNR